MRTSMKKFVVTQNLALPNAARWGDGMVQTH